MHLYSNLNPFTTEACFFVLNATAFSTKKRASVVKGLNDLDNEQMIIIRHKKM